MRTRIIATLGPMTSSKEAIFELVQAGANIFRLNFSHGDASFFSEIIPKIREVEKESGQILTIMQDLSGPKIRTADIGRGTLEIAKDEVVYFGTKKAASSSDILPTDLYICLDFPDLVSSLQVGDSLALSDGMLQFSVTQKINDDLVKIRAEGAGIVPPRKGVAFPGKTTPIAAFTIKDAEDLRLGMKLGVDAVAMSYVQTAADIELLREEMRKIGKILPIIAKLERQNAMDNLEAIIMVSDAIMVARGDLGVECDMAMLPALQKRIIKECNAHAKPVIVATQMLLSMVSSSLPTRAEVSDVANAILDGADCVMLSEETAIGQYPAKAVGFMRKIATNAESFRTERKDLYTTLAIADVPISKLLAHTACLLAEKLDCQAIVIHSISGATTRNIAAFHPRQSLYSLSPDSNVRNFMGFSYGVTPITPSSDIQNHQERAEEFIRKNNTFKKGDKVIILAGQSEENSGKILTNLVKIFEK